MKNITIIILIFTSILFLDCSENKPTEPQNNAPTIKGITVTPSVIGRNSIAKLSVEAEDVDGEHIAYWWEVSDGALIHGNNRPTVNWKAPDKLGSFRADITVSDSKDSYKESIDIVVSNIPPNKPSSPRPSNNKANVFTSTLLMWHCNDTDNDILTYDIYLGRTPTLNEENLVSKNQKDTSYSPSYLYESTTYYWKINAKDSNGGTTMGDIWSFTTFSSSCSSAIVYNGKTYNVVQIGNQCWFKENLDVGKMINSNNEYDNQTDNGVIEKYCYNNDSVYCEKYGGLYQWNEAMQYNGIEGTQGICPDGWHIPTMDDWKTLRTYVDNEATKLIDENAKSGFTYTNTTNFSALFSGQRNIPNGSFNNLNDYSYFWSSTEYSENSANNLHLFYGTETIYINEYYKDSGFSIRCLKNQK